jgi:tetratricopeptide (TPR) repeat protein
MGRHEEAIAAYQRAIKLDPDFAYPHNGLGTVYADLDRHEEAIATFQRAIRLDPDDAFPHNGLGIVYRQLDRHKEAIDAYQQAIELEPGYATAYNSLAACYRKLGRHDDYQKQLEIAQPLMEDESEYNQACFAAVAGETEEALSLLETAIQEEQVPLDWVYRDPDFDFIRDDPRFQALLDQFDETE